MSGNIHICGRGLSVKHYTGDEMSAKWCNKCERRRVHRGLVLDYPEDHVNFGYFDPIFKWECPCEVGRA